MMDSHLSRPSSPSHPDSSVLLADFLARGVDAYDRGERAVAWDWLHKTVSVSLTTNDQRAMAAAGWRLSKLKVQQGDLPEARKLSRASHEAAQAIWSRIDMAQSANLLGNLLCQAGEHDEGLRMLQSSADLFGELHDVDGQLRTWRSIGGVLRKRGEHHAAVEAWEQCLAVYRQRGELAEQARLHAAISRCWFRAGDSGAAITHGLAALGRHRHLGSERVDGDLKLLAKLRERMGDEAFTVQISRYLDPEGLGVVVGMIADYEARRMQERAAKALEEATSELSEVEQPAVQVAPMPVTPVPVAVAPTPVAPPAPRIRLPDPAPAASSDLEDQDSLSTWEASFWEGSGRGFRISRQSLQLWVLAGFGTVIGMMTVMVLLSVGAMLFR